MSMCWNSPVNCVTGLTEKETALVGNSWLWKLCRKRQRKKDVAINLSPFLWNCPCKQIKLTFLNTVVLLCFWLSSAYALLFGVSWQTRQWPCLGQALVLFYIGTHTKDSILVWSFLVPYGMPLMCCYSVRFCWSSPGWMDVLGLSIG